MAVRKTEGNSAVTLAEPQSVPNGLDQADLKDPLMQLVRQIIGPYVTHRESCEQEPCTCGLASAIGELQRREILVKRYGTV